MRRVVRDKTQFLSITYDYVLLARWLVSICIHIQKYFLSGIFYDLQTVSLFMDTIYNHLFCLFCYY